MPGEDSQGLYSRAELIEEVGITLRKLNYWHSEGILSPPALYKGQGGNSFYTRAQIKEAHAIFDLSDQCNQSVTDIKTISARIREDLAEIPEISGSKDILGLVWPEISFSSYGRDEKASELEKFKNGEKVLVEHFGSYYFIDASRHKRSYVERDGQVYRLLSNREFENQRLFAIEDFPEVLSRYAMTIQFMTGKEPKDDPEWVKSRYDLFLMFIERDLMYHPPYLYRDEALYCLDDMMTATALIELAVTVGPERLLEIVDRVVMDIATYFYLPQPNVFCDSLYLQFVRSIICFRDCIKALCQFEPKSGNDMLFYCPGNADGHWHDHTKTVMLERYRLGVIHLCRSSADGEVMLRWSSPDTWTVEQMEKIVEKKLFHPQMKVDVNRLIQDRVEALQKDLEALQDLAKRVQEGKAQ